MGDRAIITGASEGIGRGIALAFARRGFEVGLISRRETLLRAVADECRSAGAPRAEIAAIDVTDERGFREAIVRLDEALGGATCFVANAGVDSRTKPLEDNGAAARRVMHVNVLAAIDGIELMKARMLARGKPARLAGVSSVAGARGLPGAGIYCASKAALTAYLEALRLDLRSSPISVTCVAPGFIDTSMTRGARHPMPFLMVPEAAGEAFVRGILRGKPLVIAPRPFGPLHWLMRATPTWVYSRIGWLFSGR